MQDAAIEATVVSHEVSPTLSLWTLSWAEGSFVVRTVTSLVLSVRLLNSAELQ
jgi:hypothetical protein